jgi:putative protein kinase ArgK-like GTPase of G3E family
LKLQRGNFKNILKKKEKSKRRTLVKENRYRRRHSWLVSLIAQRVPERRLQTEKISNSSSQAHLAVRATPHDANVFSKD